jgi:hypothetical protein
MVDIFSEVDEELRRQKTLDVFKKYGWVFAILGVAIVVGTAAWRGYEAWQERQALASSDEYAVALTTLRSGKVDEAVTMLQKLADRPDASGYQLLARFQLASSLSVQDKPAAIEQFDAIAADTKVDMVFRDVAALRAAILALDSAPFEQQRKRLEPLAGPQGSQRHTARYLLALAYARVGDREGADRWIVNALGDADMPQALRLRVEKLEDLVRAGNLDALQKANP